MADEDRVIIEKTEPSASGGLITHPFRTWAPRAERVDLVLDSGSHPMERREGGWWELTAQVHDDELYSYSLDGSSPRPSSRARRLPAGVHGRAQLFDMQAFEWTDEDWAGIDLRSAVIYELHVGTFTPEGTLTAAIEHLDHLVDLGVTLIELMPLASFPGEHGWGYDGVGLFAVQESYGGPPALQKFVDAAHDRGLGVCLDVVYNHLGPSGNYLAEFGPYFTDQHQTPWGSAVNLDGPGSDEVQRFLLDNALMWLRDFHLDALRLDAIHALFDDRALTFIETLSASVDAMAEEVGRPLWLIGESDRNDPRTVMPRDETGTGAGGMGIHAQWSDDVHHAIHVLLTGETVGYYSDFADPTAIEKVLRTPFFHDGTWSSFRRRHHGRPVPAGVVSGWRFVASLQTHDQVGNRARGTRLSHLVSFGRLAIGAALLLTSPYTPMLFMGEEWGASTPWQYFTDHEERDLAAAISQGRQAEFAGHGWEGEVPDPQDRGTVEASKLQWEEAVTGEHARLYDWYRHLIRLRRLFSDLHDPLLDNTLIYRNDDEQTLVVHRGECRILVNLATEKRLIPVGDPKGDLEIIAAWDEPETSPDAPGAWSLPPDSVVILAPQDVIDEAHRVEAEPEEAPPATGATAEDTHNPAEGTWYLPGVDDVLG